MKIAILSAKQLVIVLGIALLLGLNILASTLSLKLDFSAGKRYSLSNSSKQILRELKKPLTIKLYLSKNLSPRLTPLKKDLFDLLDEYKVYGGSKLKLEVIYPDNDEKLEQEAIAEGITKLQFSEVEQDKFSVKNGFIGAVLLYQEKREVLPALLKPATLEYDLTSAIYRLSRKKIPSIGLFSSRGMEGLETFSELVRKQFDLSFVDFENVDSFVLDAVVYKDDRSTQLSTEQLDSLTKLIEGEQPVFILADGVWVDQNLEARAAEHGLNKVLQKYAIKINQDLLLSLLSETASFRMGDVNYLTQYPYWVKFPAEAFNPSLGFIDRNTVLTLPWVSSVSELKTKTRKTNPLIVTAKQSWSKKQPFKLLPNEIELPTDNAQQFVVAVESSNKNKELVVIGNSRFIEDDFNGRDVGNIEFFIKLLDRYINKGSLSGISFRNINYVPLSGENKNLQQTVRYFNLIAPSLLFATYGFLRYLRRKQL